MRTNLRRVFFRGLIVGSAVLVLAGVALWLRVGRHIPREMLPDIRAGLAARHIRDPEERLNKYLEVRYGPLEDPANREKVFLDFFNVDHIKALQLMVRHSPPAQRQDSIRAMSLWIEGYQASLTPEDRQRLKDRFSTDQGRVMLRRATAQYNSQSVEYRGQTAIVISQLLKTIQSVQNP